jgi:hypothetical protein
MYRLLITGQTEHKSRRRRKPYTFSFDVHIETPHYSLAESLAALKSNTANYEIELHTQLSLPPRLLTGSLTPHIPTPTIPQLVVTRIKA